MGCAAVLATACTDQPASENVPDPMSLGAPIVREGTVYTPVSVGPQGCVLYNIRIPGGQAPAALVYQTTDGGFSYARPVRCVRKVERK